MLPAGLGRGAPLWVVVLCNEGFTVHCRRVKSMVLEVLHRGLVGSLFKRLLFFRGLCFHCSLFVKETRELAEIFLFALRMLAKVF